MKRPVIIPQRFSTWAAFERKVADLDKGLLPQDRELRKAAHQMTRRRFMSGVVMAFGAAAVASAQSRLPFRLHTASVADIPPDPGDFDVFTQSDITHLGDFFVPQFPDGVNAIFTLTEGAFTGRRFGPGDDDLEFFIAGTGAAVPPGPPGNFDKCLHINYPGCSLISPPEATLIRDFGDITEGRRPVAPGGIGKIYDWEWDEVLQELMWVYTTDYEGDSHNPSFGRTTLNLSTGAISADGPWRASYHSGKTGAVLFKLPEWFRSAYGITDTYAIGSGGVRSGAGSSAWGAMLFTFTPPARGTTADTYEGLAGHISFNVTPLIGFDVDHRMERPNANAQACRWNISGPYNCGDGYYLQERAAIFGGIPVTEPYSGLRDSVTRLNLARTATKHGLLGFGHLVDIRDGVTYDDGFPHVWYSDSEHCCHGRTAMNWAGSTGPCSDSDVSYMWSFDPYQLARVHSGVIAPHEVPVDSAFQARLVGGSDMNVPKSWQHWGGSWVDEQTNRIFICEKNKDDGRSIYVRNPIVRVLQLAD
jgi:hypothetical protein